MSLLARWTIGKTKADGYRCLKESIESFLSLYEAEVVICHNCEAEMLPDLPYPLYDQRKNYTIEPMGVAWKLYPPRISPEKHEICIDNDIVFMKKIKQIDKFIANDCTLLLEGDGRVYGRFEKHVPPEYEINSGVYGMPPNFDLERYVNFYANKPWEENALGVHADSKTFDEQGIVALALLDYQKTLIIPKSSITNCEHQYIPSDGMHFIGLNRRNFHRPYKEHQNRLRKTHL
jgi:hypothetical protein